MGDFDEFMGEGGGGKSISLEVGESVTGVVISRPTKKQQTNKKTGEPLTFSDGSPRWVFVVGIATDLRDPMNAEDTGERSLWLKWKSLAAVQDAVRRSGAKTIDLGGVITLRCVGKQGEAKLYAADYQAPTPQDEFAASMTAPAGYPAPGQPAAAVAAGGSMMSRLRASQDAGAARVQNARRVQDTEPPF